MSGGTTDHMGATERLGGGRPGLPPPAPLRDRWALDPDLVFLNHGSFGACPRAVLEAQGALRAELEANPVALLGRALDARLAAVRDRLGPFLGADPDDLAFVPNATHGIATVMRSFPAVDGWGPGDEVVVTDHEYRAAINAVADGAAAVGVRVVTARIPLPLGFGGAAGLDGQNGPELAAQAVLDAVTPRTRLVLLSHVTSPTAIRLPVERLVPMLECGEAPGSGGRRIPVLVDGAHAPGMLPLDLDALGASFHTGNLHKWVCAPKGAAYLHVRRDRQPGLRPLAISHAASDPRPSPPAPSMFRREFDWTGTDDPTAILAVPAALDAVAALHPDGLPGVMAANHALTLRGRAIVLEALGAAFGSRWTTPLAPDGMLGSMATIELPTPAGWHPAGHGSEDPLAGALRERHAVEIPVFAWPLPETGAAAPGEPSTPARRYVRLSAHLHNAEGDYRHLAAALVDELRREGVG